MSSASIERSFYGDTSRWFIGTVINSHPPAGLEGRVKIRIQGIHSGDTSNIPEADLPWAQVLLPTTEGGSSGIGRIPQLHAGSLIFGMFMDGSASQIPLIFGSIPRIELPTTIQKRAAYLSEDSFYYDQERIQNVVIESIANDNETIVDPSLRRSQGMKFFIDNGYTLMHAAAIVGNLEQVSAFNTGNINSDYFGIGKWKITSKVGSRYSNLISFSSIFDPPSEFSRYSIQLQYVLFELRNAFNLANRKLIQSRNLEDASAIVSKYYIKGTLTAKAAAEKAYNEVIGQ
jgi:hypothetical protein